MSPDARIFEKVMLTINNFLRVGSKRVLLPHIKTKASFQINALVTNQAMTYMLRSVNRFAGSLCLKPLLSYKFEKTTIFSIRKNTKQNLRDYAS